MILSDEDTFCRDQAVTATAVSQNSIDLKQLRDVGPGRPVEVLVQVTEDFNNLTDLTAQIIQADNTALTTNQEVLEQSGPVVLAKLKAGYQFPLNFIPQKVSRQHLGVRFVVNGTAPTAGKITAGIINGRQANPLR